MRVASGQPFRHTWLDVTIGRYHIHFVTETWTPRLQRLRDGNRGVIEMGRRPVNGERAMTGAERMRLHRERVKGRRAAEERANPWGSPVTKTPAQLRRLERDREMHRLARAEAAVIRAAHGGKPTQRRVYGPRVYGRHKLLRDKVMEAVKVMDEQQTAHLLVMIVGEWPSIGRTLITTPNAT
jgi:hypothetical protein